MNSPVWRFRFKTFPGIVLALSLVLAAGLAVAQSHAAPAQKPQAAQPHTAPRQQTQEPPQAQPQPGINEEFGQPLASESAEAAGRHVAGAKEENAQEKMVEELKLSPSVRWMAEHLHISAAQGYWVGILLDFAILALLLIIALKKNLPAMFRTRTASIQRGIEEARKASAEAQQRLAGIEARLVKLDQEVAGMRAAAEQEAVAEEQRILSAAEEEKRRIVQAATAEIAAAEKLARRELKAYTADLAVTLAERRIHIDTNTDKTLVRSFAQQLVAPPSDGGKPGKDGQ